MTSPLISPIIWDGEPDSPVERTAFGFYDSDATFVNDAPNVAMYCARHLGWPVLDIELTNEQFYTAFEEAITEYSSQVNQFNIREYMLTVQGLPTSSTATQKFVQGTPLPTLVTIAAEYGTEDLVGGRVDVKRGFVTASNGVQDYDLQALWANTMESGSRIEIRKVYYDNSPAIARYFDPYAGAGVGLQNLLTEFGFDGFSPAVSFVMLPAYEDLLRIQAIEFNDMIRKSQFSFQIVNNKLRLFPIPTSGLVVYFDYIVTQDKLNDILNPSSTIISDYSNVPYQNIKYGNINDVGRRWIFRYTLALAKEMLGAVRSKYESIPIPNAEVRLDGQTLRQEAVSEKQDLITQLRETLEETGRKKQMEKAMENSKNMQEVFKQVPLLIYIG